MPVFKANDTSDASNYRGITINSCIGKVFNTVLNKRLDTFLMNNNIIHDTQIGSRKKARTADHLFVLKTLIDNYFNKGKKLFACFIDLKKAFDTVSRACLLTKLHDIDVGGIFLKTLESMFSNDQLCVRVGHQITPFFKSNIGVRQGDPLSANLFNIFLNGIPTLFDNTCSPVQLGNRLLSCLLYADDIVLLSESAVGLQNAINLLQSHCEENGLTINTLKSQIMIFNKGGRQLNYHFKLNGRNLDIAREYKYLGIMFTPSGSFTCAKEHLYKKSLKAYFKLKKAISGIHNVKLGRHLFDHTVSPILTYGSEILGAFKSTMCNVDQMKFRDIYSHSKMETTQRKFARFLLGVHKQCPTDALYGELGWHPLYSKIIISLLKYWHRLANQEPGSLLGNALQTHANIKSCEGSNFIDTIEIILSKINISSPLAVLSNYAEHHWSKLIKIQVSKCLDSEWKDSISRSTGQKGTDGCKLRTYALFKSQFQLEPYLLHVKNKEHRKSLCHFRTSCHKLRIERGRYLNVKVADRICLYCTQHKVEDELHFLLECPLYNEDRAPYLKKLTNKYPHLSALTNNQLFIWLMSAEDNEMTCELAKYVHSCFNKRSSQSII
jgi:hypothetical protein